MNLPAAFATGRFFYAFIIIVPSDNRDGAIKGLCYLE
jgi:hypothetical protein